MTDDMEKLTENSSSEENEAIALAHLRKLEVRFHIVKLAIIIVMSIFTSLTVIHYTRQDNNRTRNQINCIVDGFLKPPQDVSDAVHKCRK